MILVTEDDDLSELPHEPEPPEEPDASLQPDQVDASLDSMHFYLSHAALGNSLSLRTLRIHGFIQGLQVTILIDSGSSHNIVQPRVAEFLKLPIEVYPSFFSLSRKW